MGHSYTEAGNAVIWDNRERKKKFFNVRFVWIDANVYTSTQALKYIIRFKQLKETIIKYIITVLFCLFWLDSEIREIMGKTGKQDCEMTLAPH